MLSVEITDNEVAKILAIEENHFNDLKSKRISPGKLSRSICALANADGGELHIGIEDDPRQWDGCSSVEDFNGHIQAFEALFPLGNGCNYSFLHSPEQTGFILKVEIFKSHDIKKASNNVVYLRRGAQNLPQEQGPPLDRLKHNKGITSFETELVNAEIEVVTESDAAREFIAEVVPATEPSAWLKKQRLIIAEKPTVAGVMLFADEPQAMLPKRSGIKIYRYQTRDTGERATLVYDPITVEGNIYSLIETAVKETTRQIEDIKVMTSHGLQGMRYPNEALHEIVTNAVLHRDYSVPDDIHIRIFDNRVEVQSPGLLPAHITPQNILEERFARNGVIVRLINKFPDPPNKDVGEGLNTAFEAMKTMRLVAPEIRQAGLNVVVTLRHESLATPQTLIIEYLENHESISNKKAREITNQQSENAMKHILKRMVVAGMLKVVPGRTVFQTKYVRGDDNRTEGEEGQPGMFD